MFPCLLCCSSSVSSVGDTGRGFTMLQYEEDTNFLHGTLKIDVIEARDLPDTDNAFFNISRGDWTDPYVVVYLDKTELCKTAYLMNNLNPVWNERFSVDVCHHANHLRLSVTDKDCVGTFDVGGCLIDLRQLMDGEKVRRRKQG